MDKKSFGMMAAATVALLSAGTVLAGPKVTKGHVCQNNSCKGKSACSGLGNNSCGGQNSCKGKGWLDHDNEKDWAANGGKWAKAEADKGAAKKDAAPGGKADGKAHPTK